MSHTGKQECRTVVFKKRETNEVSPTVAPVYYLEKVYQLGTQAEPRHLPKLRRQRSEFREASKSGKNLQGNVPERSLPERERALENCKRYPSNL